MKEKCFSVILTCALTLGPAPSLFGGDQKDNGNGRGGDKMGHVLLISIDGMHALDYLNCVSGGYCPTLASLGNSGVSYTRTSTARPSDSFPGLMALVTGATPKTVGAFYDVAWAPRLHLTLPYRRSYHKNRRRHGPRGLAPAPSFWQERPE